MASIAVNDDTGEVRFLDDAGAWQPARTAVNPETKQLLAHDGKDWVPVPAKSKGVLNYIDDAVRSLASGVTFGFADEIAAKANTVFGLGAKQNLSSLIEGKGSAYEQNLAAERARDKQIPLAIKLPGEVAGAVASTVAAAPVTGTVAALTGLSKLPAIVRSVGTGATGGALFGAGDAEEGDRLEGAAKGAAIGGVAGAIVPKIVNAAVKTGQYIRNAVMPESGAAADLSRAIARDADTPEALAARAADLMETRPGVATLADAGGENVKGLVERVAQTPGAGRTIVVPALTDRQQGQMGRIAGDLRDLTDTRRTAVQAVEQTMAQRKEAAQPLYKQAYEEGDQAVWSPALERLSSSPSVQRAMQGAVRVWRDVAVADGFGGMNPGALVDKGNLSFLNGKVPVFPNLQFWDYTKRIIDDQVSAAIRSGQNQKAKTLGTLAEQLRTELDNVVPTFAQARNAWAGPSKYLDAIEEGRTILSNKISAEELTARLASPTMTDAEREAYRVGAVSALTGKMGNDAAKLGDMTKYVRSPEMRAKIAAIMPTEEAAAKWSNRLDFEVGSSELTGRALGNSATARRLAERQDADGMVGDLVMDALTGTPAASLWHTILKAGPQKIKDTLRSKTDARLGRLLTESQDASELARAFEKMGSNGLPASDTTKAAATQGTNALLEYYNNR